MTPHAGPGLSFPRTALLISAGVIVWALHFAAIYGYTALACARGWTGLVAPVVGAATVLAAGAMLVLIVLGWRRRRVFEHWLSAAIAALALVAIVYEGITPLWIAPCG